MNPEFLNTEGTEPKPEGWAVSIFESSATSVLEN